MISEAFSAAMTVGGFVFEPTKLGKKRYPTNAN